MPPKPKFTREKVVEVALTLVGERGMAALTARELGERLGSSARPIFTVFRNMEELTEAVREAAGDEQLAVVLSRKLDCHVPSERGGSAADVHGHVQYGTFHDAHQFPLCMFSALEMEPPQHAV